MKRKQTRTTTIDRVCCYVVTHKDTFEFCVQIARSPDGEKACKLIVAVRRGQIIRASQRNV